MFVNEATALFFEQKLRTLSNNYECNTESPVIQCLVAYEYTNVYLNAFVLKFEKRINK